MSFASESDQILKSGLHEAENLLSEAIRSLRFHASAGYSGGDCGTVNLERLQRWSDQDCLRFSGVPPETAADIIACRGCPLEAGRTNRIAGAGFAGARVMFIMGYPSYSADREKTPYAGESGRLLVRILAAMSLAPDDVYVTYAVKCRPPDGREPSAEEARHCINFLEREIKAVAPDMICALGEFAARSLLDKPEPLESLRGKFYERNGVRVMPTWHPDDMIDDSAKKRPAWEDFRKVMAGLDII